MYNKTYLAPLLGLAVSGFFIFINSAPAFAAQSKIIQKVPQVEGSAQLEESQPQAHASAAAAITLSPKADTEAPAVPNLVPNPGVEQAGSDGLPLSWKQGGYGDNERTFSYPVLGVNGSKAVQVSITGYTNGDADWYFVPLALQPGVYHYADRYSADVPSLVELQIHNADGSYSYEDLQSLPPASGFASSSVDFSVPPGTQDVTVYHLIEAVGTLTIDSTSVKEKYPLKGIYLTGGISLRFDDGWDSQYTVAYPKLESAGLTGTFYIITRQLLDDDFSGFMSIAEVKDLYAHGEEIGDHTQTHPHLPQLTRAQQYKEIVGAKNDLISWGIDPVLSFAYPYGEYNNATVSIIKNNGFTNAAATLDNDVPVTQNPYTINGYSVQDTDSLASLEAMVDHAMASKDWLVLGFHRIDMSGDQYSITPDNFNALIDYIVSKHVPVVPVSQGAQDLERYGK